MKREKIFWGIFFIAAAILLLVSKLNLFAGVGGVKMGLTIFFAAILIRSVRDMNFGGILFPLAFIGIIFDRQLGITALTPWTLLAAALLGTIGLSMMFKKKSHNDYWSAEDSAGYDRIEAKEYYEGAEIGDDRSKVHYKTSFSAGIKYVNANDFQYADLECSFGAMKVFFDNATIADHATIHVNISFGALELYLPKSWNLINQADVSFAGIEEKNINDSSGTPIVTLTGEISFSGLSIFYV